MKTPPDDAGPLLPGPLETTAPISNAAPRAWRSLGHLSGAWSAALRAATLNRTLRNLGVRGKGAHLVSGMGKVTFAEPTTLLWFALDGFAVYLATTDDEAVQSMSISLLNTLGA